MVSNHNISKTLVRLLLVISLSLGLVACQANSGSSEQQSTPTPLPAQPALAKPTYVVERGEVVEMMRFNGRIAPVVQESLYFRVSGRVKNVYVQEGDTVTAGQVIADLEGVDELMRRARLNELSQRRVEIQLEMALLNLEMFMDQNYPWETGYEQRLAQQELQVELAQISLEESSLNSISLRETLSDSMIIAPIDGKLISLRLLPGREVQNYKEVGLVADISQLEVSASLNAADMERLEEGLPVLVKTSSGLVKEFPGFIRRLPYPYGSSGQVTTSTEGASGESETRVAFDQVITESDFRLSDLVSVEVILAQEESTLWLPPQAVRVFEGRNFVIVQDGDIQRRVDVKLGLQGEERVEILSGLEEGQLVLRP